MKQRKIRVFLGGYVNFLNAQNINCRALSEHLNPDRFEVWTMMFWYQNAADFQPLPRVHYLRSLRPTRILGWIPYVLGLLRCDVAFLPKGEYNRLCRFIARLSGCKLFSTVEGILSDSDLSKVSDAQRFLKDMQRFEPNLYAITKHIKNHVAQKYDYHFADRVLYLGVEADNFLNTAKANHTGELRNICFIGNNLVNKSIEDFFEMSKLFPELSFHIIGTNVLWKEQTLEDYLAAQHLTNITYHGRLDHTQMARVLRDMDLMFFPSRSEGFPKVMLETACAGVPTLCYADYGADEWITTGRDGYVVRTFDEAADTLRHILRHPEHLRELSQAAIALGRRFDWKTLVTTWEQEIQRIYTTPSTIQLCKS